MKGFCIVLPALLLTLSACKGKQPDVRTAEPDKGQAGEGEGAKKPAQESGKKVLMIIACDEFRDEELAEPKKIFLDAGMSVTVASDRKEGCTGMLGGKAGVDMLLGEARAADYDAVVFVGGAGAKVLFDSADAHKIAKGAAEGGKVLGAICIAPSILARAGLLKGRNATVFEGDEFVGILKSGGAAYSEDSVVVDGNIVTANGPPAARAFGEKIAELLK
ncbi:MAG: DJ-1/PfpI family protein [Pseudomonadota bacterium]